MGRPTRPAVEGQAPQQGEPCAPYEQPLVGSPPIDHRPGGSGSVEKPEADGVDDRPVVERHASGSASRASVVMMLSRPIVLVMARATA